MRYITIGQKVQSQFVNKKQRVVPSQGASNSVIAIKILLDFSS